MSKPYFGFLQAMAEEMEAKRRSMVRSISSSCADEEDWVQFAAAVGLLVTDEDREWYRVTYEGEK